MEMGLRALGIKGVASHDSPSQSGSRLIRTRASRASRLLSPNFVGVRHGAGASPSWDGELILGVDSDVLNFVVGVVTVLARAGVAHRNPEVGAVSEPLPGLPAGAGRGTPDAGICLRVLRGRRWGPALRYGASVRSGGDAPSRPRRSICSCSCRAEDRQPLDGESARFQLWAMAARESIPCSVPCDPGGGITMAPAKRAMFHCLRVVVGGRPTRGQEEGSHPSRRGSTGPSIDSTSPASAD